MSYDGIRVYFDIGSIVLFFATFVLAVILALMVLETPVLRNREDMVTPEFKPWFLPALFVGFVLPPVVLGCILFSVDLIDVCLSPGLTKIEFSFKEDEKEKLVKLSRENKKIKWGNSVQFEGLPYENDNKFKKLPRNLRRRIRYEDKDKKELVFIGLMTDDEKGKLLEAPDDIEWKKAIGDLHLKAANGKKERWYLEGVMTEKEKVELIGMFSDKKKKIEELFEKTQPLLRGIWIDSKKDYVLEYWLPFFFICIWIASLWILIRIAIRFDPYRHSYSIIRRRGITAFFKYIGRQHSILFYGSLIFNYAAFLAFLFLGPHADEKGPGVAFLITGAYTISTVWFIPLFNAWLKFNTIVLDDCVRSDLHKTIRKLKGHKVLLGFRALGGNVCKEILQRDPIDSNTPVRPRGRRRRRDELERGTFLENRLVLVDSDYEVDRVTKEVRYRKLVYLATDMVIVDDDEKLFDKVYTDPSLERIGIAKVEYDSIRHDRENRLTVTKEEVWIPAIIGDVTNESVIDNCALDRCDFFIDTIEGYDESLRVSKFAHDNPGTRGIITVSDSAQKEFLYPRHSGHGIFLVYPTRQRGISLAEVVYPAMVNTCQERPNVLVFTDDLRQTHYMIETILQELKLGDRLRYYLAGRDSPNPRERVDLRITICGEVEEIKRVCYPKTPRHTFAGLDERSWVEVIERCGHYEFAQPCERYYIRSRVLLEKPHLMTMEKIINAMAPSPEIIVISYKDTVNILKVLHDWIIAVERANSPMSSRTTAEGKIQLRYYPKIIVGFQGEEERDVRDWLQYYDTLCRDSDDSWGQYPRQAIDCIVDLNKDSRENIAAIVDAWRYRWREE